MFQSQITIFREVQVGNQTLFELFREATPEEVPEHGYIVVDSLIDRLQLDAMLWVD